jgi:hypothetical protein
MCSQTRFGNPLLAALLILASGSALAATAQAGATLDSEASRNAEIEGRQVDLCAPISSANVWGPPGYGENPARAHTGKRMRLQGKLALATAPGDARPVVLDVDRITPCTSRR